MQASAKSITRQHAANKQIEEATNAMKKHTNLELKQSHQYSNKICLLPYPTEEQKIFSTILSKVFGQISYCSSHVGKSTILFGENLKTTINICM